MFNVVKKNDIHESNYRLRENKASFELTVYDQLVRPDGDGYEVVGMLAVPRKVEVQEKVAKREVRMRLGRKQRSARLAVPRETITVVPVIKPAPVEVAMARIKILDEVQLALELEAKPADIANIKVQGEQAIEVAKLEARIRELLGIVNAPKIAAQRKAESIRRLEELFNNRRPKAVS